MSGPDPRAETLNWSDLGVSELPTGTVTLLLADVEGSTRLWEAEPDAMADAVARLDRCLTDLVSSHQGVRPVEQGEGDSFVVAFARASDAIACALALQQAPLAPIRLRIGVHTGEIRLRDEGNYIGPTINRAARLRDLAHGGQTVLSGVTEELVFEQLPAGAWLADLGTHTLRDVARPERVTQLCHPDLRNEFPPLRVTKGAVPQRLPTQFTSFVGRRDQMAEIRAHLSEHRLVTLTGAGGAGKTRLAIELAAQLGGEFADGVWYVDLAPITNPALVPTTVARAFGLPDQPGSSAEDTLIRFINNRSVLVVLDNCEHLADACATTAAAILSACPAVTLLATSREPIRAVGEITWSVPSLSLDDEAVELFTDRARQSRPDFAVTDENASAVAEICQRLDGMPLAIELAAARIRALSLTEIVDSLHDRFRLLTGGARTAVRRQQTLRASVDWSHALLSEQERVLFRRLAVFLGGFDLDAAQAVAGGHDVERFQVLDQLTLLVDKSLAMAESGSGRTRYRLLETVRQYALEKLGESGEAGEVRTRHRDYFTSKAAKVDAPSQTDYEQRIEQAEIEIANLRAAFGWSVETGDIKRAMELTSSLLLLWLTRGLVTEGLTWLDVALSGVNAPTDSADIREARTRALADKALLLATVGVPEGVEEADEALASARELDDPTLLVRALMARGAVSAFDVDTARPYLDEGAERARELGNPWWLARILNWQAVCALQAGDMTATRSASEEALALAGSIGDGFVSRSCHLWLANAQTYKGALAEAIAQFRSVVDEAVSADDVLVAVIGLVGQSFAEAVRGEFLAAQALADEALDRSSNQFQYYDIPSQGAITFSRLAAGDANAAWEASEVARQFSDGHPMTWGIFLVWAAQAALARGELAEARRLAEGAVSMRSGVYLSSALSTRAAVNVAQGALDEAEVDARQALSIAANVGGEVIVPDVLECLADIARIEGSHRDAVRLNGMAAAARERMGSRRFKVFDDAHEKSVAELRAALGDNDFDEAWAEGASLSMEAAIAFVQRGRGERKRPATGWAALTPTELDVVRLVGEGLSNKDIAARLFVSPRTAESHLSHVYSKLGLSSRVQLAQEATRHAAGATKSAELP
jgi:predicted ATPase/class 3 adenylate cyclase/DNA-binding CsgD family transcriptional regulator